MTNVVEQIIFVLGFVALFIIMLAVAVAAVGGVAYLVLRFMPRVHRGRPVNEGELCFYDYRTITTGKDGERITGQRRMINAPLAIKWWLGISPRPKPKWFIGIIRWEPKS